MFLISLGLVFVFWLLGRLAARALVGPKDIAVLSREPSASFFRGSWPRRAAFRLGGPLVAYLGVVALAFLALRAQGAPSPRLILDVTPGGPAAAAGMLSGDQVLAVDGVELARRDDARGEGSHDVWETFVEAMKAASPGRARVLQIERAGRSVALTVVTNQEGKIRVVRRPERVEKPTGQAVREAVAMPASSLLRFWSGASKAFSPAEPASLAGPVAIVRSTASARPDRLGGGPEGRAFWWAVLAYPTALAWPLALGLEILLRPRRPARTPGSA